MGYMPSGRKLDPDLKAPVPLVKNRGRPPDPRRRRPVEVRNCERHGETEFASYSRGPSVGRRWACKRCVGEAVTRRKQKLKRILVEAAGLIESPPAGAKFKGRLEAA